MSNIWYLYILRCSDNSYYTGITIDLDKRLKKHNTGKASRYTRARLPVKMIFGEQVGSHSDALKEEHKVKRMSRKEKEQYMYDNSYSFEKRQKEKQKSREEDERRLAAGEVTREQLDEENSFLKASRTIIHWNKSERLK